MAEEMITLFHGTSSPRASSIKRFGLTAPAPSGHYYSEYRYMLTTSLEVAEAYATYSALIDKRAGARPVVVEIQIPKDRKSEFLHPGQKQGLPDSALDEGYPGEPLPSGVVPDPLAEAPGRAHTVYAMKKAIPPEFITYIHASRKTSEFNWRTKDFKSERKRFGRTGWFGDRPGHSLAAHGRRVPWRKK